MVKNACYSKETKMKIVEITEKRRNPSQNTRSGSGKYDLINYAEDNISDFDNWAVSMTVEPKLGINPKGAVSEDTPKGIYFYPLQYFMKMADRDEALPWADNFPYMQLFQYDRSGEMTQQTKVDPAKLKQALLQYCSEEVIQQASEEGDYDGTPYWFIYDCLSRLGKSDETNVIRWNKVLRDLGFTSVYDPGKGWIAYNEPTQGVVLDPRIIKQHKTFANRNPTLQRRRYDIQGLADAIGWSSYYQRESQIQRVQINHPDEKKVMLAVAKSMLRPFLGKNDKEAKDLGYDQTIKAAADKVIEILKGSNESIEEAFDQPYKLKWEKGDHGDVDAYAKLDDGNYLSIMFNKGYSQGTKEEAWSVEFFRNNSQEVTGEGDAQRVFATVLSAIQTFIKKYKPNRIIFSASKEVDDGQNAESRAGLYDRLVQRYAKAWGFRAFRADTGNKVIYELNRIKPVSENGSPYLTIKSAKK